MTKTIQPTQNKKVTFSTPSDADYITDKNTLFVEPPREEGESAHISRNANQRDIETTFAPPDVIVRTYDQKAYKAEIERRVETIKKQFSPEDLEALKDYARKLAAWKKREPRRYSDKRIISIVEYYAEHGNVPEEYNGKAEVKRDPDPERGGYVFADLRHAAWETEHPKADGDVVPRFYEAIHDTKNGLACSVSYDAESKQYTERLNKWENLPDYDPEADYKIVTDALKKLLPDLTQAEAKELTIVKAFASNKTNLLTFTNEFEKVTRPRTGRNQKIYPLMRQIEIDFDEITRQPIGTKTAGGDLQPVTVDNYTENVENWLGYIKNVVASSLEEGNFKGETFIVTKKSFCQNTNAYYIENPDNIQPTTTERKGKSLHDVIYDLELLWEMVDGDQYRWFIASSVTKGADGVIFFQSPAAVELLRRVKETPVKSYLNKATGEEKQLFKMHFLIHADINDARNKATAEMVKGIINAVVEHGIKPESKRKKYKQFEEAAADKVTKTISVEDLITNNAYLLAAYKDTKAKTRFIQRALYGTKYEKTKGAYNTEPLIVEYLRKYTDAFNYWLNFNVSVPDPDDTIQGKRNQGLNIKVTHYGLNGEFESKKGKFKNVVIDKKDVPEVLKDNLKPVEKP